MTRWVTHEIDYKVSAVWGDITTLRSKSGEELGRQGVLKTPYGTVEVEITPLRDGYQSVILSTMIGGRRYMQRQVRPPSQRISSRGAKTIAHRWIRELHARLEEGR